MESGPDRKKGGGLNARQSPCNQSPCGQVRPEGWTLRARVRPKNTARRIMTMTFRLLLTAVVLATTPPVWAAPTSDGYCADAVDFAMRTAERSEEHTSELQSLMRKSYAVFCLKKNTPGSGLVAW